MRFRKQLDDFLKGVQDTLPSFKTFSLFTHPSIIKILQDIVVINCFSIGMNIVFENIILPIDRYLIGDSLLYTQINYLYFALWTIPFTIIYTGLNLYYWQNLAKTIPISSEYADNNTKPNLLFSASSAIFRLLLIPGLAIQQYAIGKIPWLFLRYPLQIASRSLEFGFYAFEYHWNKSNLTITKQIIFFEKNWSYFFGFGLPLACAYYFMPQLYADNICSILFPAFVIISSRSSLSIQKQDELSKKHTWFDRLPYFSFAKILPIMVSFLCKKKMEHLDKIPELENNLLSKPLKNEILVEKLERLEKLQEPDEPKKMLIPSELKTYLPTYTKQPPQNSTADEKKTKNLFEIQIRPNYFGSPP